MELGTIIVIVVLVFISLSVKTRKIIISTVGSLITTILLISTQAAEFYVIYQVENEITDALIDEVFKTDTIDFHTNEENNDLYVKLGIENDQITGNVIVDGEVSGDLVLSIGKNVISCPINKGNYNNQLLPNCKINKIKNLDDLDINLKTKTGKTLIKYKDLKKEYSKIKKGNVLLKKINKII